MVTGDAGVVRHRVHLPAEDTKGSVGGDVVLNEALRWRVARYRTWRARRGHAVEGDAPVFMSRNHRRLSVRMAQEAWRAVQWLAGIERPYPFHALRHCFGTNLYLATKDPFWLTQLAMRHRSASSTELYTHVGERDVEAAVELLG
jgi:site-specific recombinase XerD